MLEITKKFMKKVIIQFLKRERLNDQLQLSSQILNQSAWSLVTRHPPFPHQCSVPEVIELEH